MRRIVTTVYDPIALIATCQRLGLHPPGQGWIQLDADKVFGWIVHLPRLYCPLVFNTLTGLVAYSTRDNAYLPFSKIMRFILQYYALRARLQPGDAVAARCRNSRKRSSPVPAQ